MWPMEKAIVHLSTQHIEKGLVFVFTAALSQIYSVRHTALHRIFTTTIGTSSIETGTHIAATGVGTTSSNELSLLCLTNEGTDMFVPFQVSNALSTLATRF